MDTEAAELITRIRAAFRNQEAPDPASMMMDNSGNHLECEEIRKDFAGKKPEELSTEKLFYHRGALAFFNPKAVVYYLPAFLTGLVIDYYGMDTAIYSVTSELVPEALHDGFPENWGRTEEGAELIRSVDSFWQSGYMRERVAKTRELLRSEEWAVIKEAMAYLEKHYAQDFIGSSPMKKVLQQP